MIQDPYYMIAMSGTNPIGIDLESGIVNQLDPEEQRMRAINRAIAPQATDLARSLNQAGFPSESILSTLEKYSEDNYGQFGDMLMFGDEPFSGDINEFKW